MRQKSKALAIVAITAASGAACLIAASAAWATPLPGRANAVDIPAQITLVQGSVDAKRGEKGPAGKGPGPLAAAAKELGISERALAEAVGPAPPNVERGAKILGIAPERLRAVLEKHRPPAKK